MTGHGSLASQDLEEVLHSERAATTSLRRAFRDGERPRSLDDHQAAHEVGQTAVTQRPPRRRLQWNRAWRARRHEPPPEEHLAAGIRERSRQNPVGGRKSLMPLAQPIEYRAFTSLRG